MRLTPYPVVGKKIAGWGVDMYREGNRLTGAAMAGVG
jgi:hypothetical protein